MSAKLEIFIDREDFVETARELVTAAMRGEKVENILMPVRDSDEKVAWIFDLSANDDDDKSGASVAYMAQKLEETFSEAGLECLIATNSPQISSILRASGFNLEECTEVQNLGFRVATFEISLR